MKIIEVTKKKLKELKKIERQRKENEKRMKLEYYWREK